MAGIKSLAKDTAIYGTSSILGRFLNWCLVPMYTRVFPEAQYGIVTNLYAYVAILLVILIYGMETGFFRFTNHERWENPMQVYSTSLISLLTTSSVFIFAVCLLSPEIAGALGPRVQTSYVWMLGVTIGIDAFTAIPFSYMRYKKRPIRFATLKFINIGLNIGLNLFFILLCPWLWTRCPGLISWFYSPTFGIGYIFLANLISSIVTLLMVTPELRVPFKFNGKLLKEMLVYSFPLLILGAAGLMNQTIDKILFPFLYDNKALADEQLGIYGANYKIAIVMVMFTQAFRFAYEPFIFAKSKGESVEQRKKSYSDAMKYFIIFSLFIFLGVMFYLDIIKHFIGSGYTEGIKVVPIVMLAELFFGVFFNLSLWYKLTDKTIWGTWFSLMGLAVTVVGNVLFVPRYGYIACAWSAFASYGFMMVISYFVGQKKYPIKYNLPRIAIYVISAMALYLVAIVATTDSAILNYAIRTVLLALYIAVVFRFENPLAYLRHKKAPDKL